MGTKMIPRNKKIRTKISAQIQQPLRWNAHFVTVPDMLWSLPQEATRSFRIMSVKHLSVPLVKSVTKSSKPKICARHVYFPGPKRFPNTDAFLRIFVVHIHMEVRKFMFYCAMSTNRTKPIALFWRSFGKNLSTQARCLYQHFRNWYLALVLWRLWPEAIRILVIWRLKMI